MSNKKIDRDKVKELIKMNFNDHQIAKKLNCHRRTIQKIRTNELDLPENSGANIDLQILRKLSQYGFNDQELATFFNSTKIHIFNLRKKLSIPASRKRRETLQKVVILDKILQAVIKHYPLIQKDIRIATGINVSKDDKFYLKMLKYDLDFIKSFTHKGKTFYIPTRKGFEYYYKFVKSFNNNNLEEISNRLLEETELSIDQVATVVTVILTSQEDTS